MTKNSELTQPLLFQPIFMERIWGGRRLEREFGKRLPENKKIGEAWEIVDRPEVQSIVRDGPLRGQTLHELWTTRRSEIFGQVPDAARFPLLIKLLDAEKKLSLQVHPPAPVAARLGGEAKTEFWYVAKADPGALLYVGLREASSAQDFRRSIGDGTVVDRIQTIPVEAGDAMFLPAGRFHAIGGGNLLVEVQQNSDSTYRVFDWNRQDDGGKKRALHIEEALQSIDFDDCNPALVKPIGELLLHHELFEIQKWNVETPREIAPPGQFAIVCILTGVAAAGGIQLRPGEFCLVPAELSNRSISAMNGPATLLRVTIPL
jgi:mannose-6-phosphate isomerase